MNPADEVEVPHVERAVRAACQCHGGKQHHVPSCATAAWTAGDTPVKTIPHHSADHRRLLGEEDVFPVSFVKDSWGRRNAINTLEALKTHFLNKLLTMGDRILMGFSPKQFWLFHMTDVLYLLICLSSLTGFKFAEKGYVTHFSAAIRI